jgi:hypothetical protein
MNGFLSCDRFIHYACQSDLSVARVKWLGRRMSWPKRRPGGLIEHGRAF